VRWIDRTSRKLARNNFYQMVRFGPKLEKRQAILGRIVDIGAELFVMSCACVHAQRLVRETPSDRTPLELADLFCRRSQRRVEAAFRDLYANDDVKTYDVARSALDGAFAWLEKGPVSLAESYPPEEQTGADDPRSSATEEPAGPSGAGQPDASTLASAASN